MTNGDEGLRGGGEMKTIVVIRHPEKDGDKITAKGAMQIFAATLALVALGYKPTKFFYSGARRTFQALLVGIAAMAETLGMIIPEIVKCDWLHFQPILDKLDRADADAVLTDIKKIKAAGGTLKIALEMSKYAVLARERMGLALVHISSLTEDDETAFALSHSPLTEMAALDIETAPYALGEADAVVYEMDGAKLVSSKLIKAPIEGKTN